MILDDTIEIKICPANFVFWKNKNYDVKINTTHTVSIKDLPEKSNVKLRCVCDACNNVFIQRYSRNKDVCGRCRTSFRMKDNKFGIKKTENIPPRKELQLLIDDGKGKKFISEKYKVSIPVVNRWLRRHNINIIPYYGIRYFKTLGEENDIIKKINDMCSQKQNISEVSRKMKIPRHILNDLRKRGKININSFFDISKNEYDKIVKNLPLYVEENKKKSLKTISQEYNISIEQLKKAFFENNIKVNLHSYNKSKGELECRKFITDLGFNCFSVNFGKTYEIDCFVKDQNFGVEYCGEYWHRYEPNKNNKNYHKNKYNFCKKQNVKILTIFECEWFSKRDIIESIIKSKLGVSTKLYARKCTISEVESVIACDFHDKNHISGHIKSSINLGLFYDGELISVLSFVKSRFDRNYEYEISRFSTKLNTTVVGGLSKLFSFFVKTYAPDSCITYADLRFGDGKAYEKIGFSFITQTPSNYFYFKKNGNKLESRLKYQKNKLQSMPGYDISKTEFEIMKENNYYRIYDCGNNKFVWKNNK